MFSFSWFFYLLYKFHSQTYSPVERGANASHTTPKLGAGFSLNDKLTLIHLKLIGKVKKQKKKARLMGIAWNVWMKHTNKHASSADLHYSTVTIAIYDLYCVELCFESQLVLKKFYCCNFKILWNSGAIIWLIGWKVFASAVSLSRSYSYDFTKTCPDDHDSFLFTRIASARGAKS